jgi:spoIIIJ-associated protein
MENNKIDKKDLGLIQEIVEKLLSLSGIDASVDVSEDVENGAVLVDLKDTKEAGLLIGSRGETIFSIQSVVSMIFFKRSGKWLRIFLNVADWRDKQQSKLSSIALQAADRARTTGEAQHLYNLNSSQRRSIHLELSNEKDIETESVGEGEDRYLVVKPKKD